MATNTMNSICIRTLLLMIFSNITLSTEITNFKSGLACTDGKTFGWICHEVSKIYITGQGKCTWNKEAKSCTWYGFEFDYKGMTEGTKILCTSKSSHTWDKGDPKEIVEENISESVYELPVPLGDGHFFNPQYSILSTNDSDSNSVKNHTIFRIKNDKVFEFEFEYIYPFKSHNKALKVDAANDSGAI